MSMPDGDAAIVNATRSWLEKVVIGLNLCPFAKAVHAAGQIRYRVSAATTPEGLLKDLAEELIVLSETDAASIDTTLLIHPQVLTDFLDYNDFAGVIDAVVSKLGLYGVIQVATFHPRYQFADTAPDDVTNRTNRSPFPTLHLLREASVERALKSYPDADQIPARNMETMRRLQGEEGGA